MCCSLFFESTINADVGLTQMTKGTAFVNGTGKVLSASEFSGTAYSNQATISNSSDPIFSGKGLSGGADLVEKELSGSVSKEHDIKTLIISWTNFLLPIAVTLSVLAIVWAGFLYITALGDDGNMDKAKNIIIWVVVGLLAIAAAYAIVNFVMTATF